MSEMPAVSRAQRRFMAWKEHTPGGPKSMGMSKQSMSDFASTPEAGLPEHADQGMPPAQRRHQQWVGHHNGPAQSVFPAGHTMNDVTHKFAKTTDEHMDKGGWISRATSSPGFKKGALTAQAKRVGETPMQFARQHEHDSGRTGRRARFAINAAG